MKDVSGMDDASHVLVEESNKNILINKGDMVGLSVHDIRFEFGCSKNVISKQQRSL
jgi:hypothetical protein